MALLSVKNVVAQGAYALRKDVKDATHDVFSAGHP